MKGNIIDAAKNLLGGDFTTDITYGSYSAGNETVNIRVTGDICFLFLWGSASSGLFNISGLNGYHEVYGLMDSGSGPFNWTYRLPPRTEQFTVDSNRHWFVIYFKKVV